MGSIEPTWDYSKVALEQAAGMLLNVLILR